MKKFKNSKTAKVVSGFVGLAATLLMVAPSIASAESYVFTKTLKQGMSDQEVMNLQKVLNASADTMVSASGVGSAGMETMYFGGLTKSAVMKFQEKYASDILTPIGLTKGTGLVGAATRAKLNMMSTGGSVSTVQGCTSTTGFSPITGQPCSSQTTGTVSVVPGCTSTVGYSPVTGQPCSGMTTTPTTGTGPLTAALDANSPTARTLISPSGIATLATFKLMNSGTAPVKVTMLKFKRTGVSSDVTLNNVYLYDGSGMRLTDAASIASSVINFSDSAGLVVIPAGGSVSVSVRGDIASSMNGQTIGVMLTDATTDAGVVTGTPVSGAEHTLATAPSGMATANFSSSSMPGTSAGQTIDPQNDYTVWGAQVAVGSRDVLMSALRVQQIGSVYVDDVQNFRLMVDGVQMGTAVMKADANRFVTFTFPTPVTLKAGSHVIKIMADLVGGSNRNFQFSLRRVVDVELWDSQLNVSVTPTVLNNSFVAVEALNTVGINVGTLTITKSTDSPSGNVVNNGTAVTLAKFKVKAQGEKLKVENLRVSHTASDAVWTGIRNGGLYLDGVQIGSTATLNEDSQGTPYTQYNLGSSMILEPGKEYTLEVRGDVYNTNTTSGTALSAGTTTIVNIVAGSSNIYRMASLSYTTNSAQSGNSVTVAAGTLSLAKYTAYANQTVTVPQNAYKIGDFRVTTGSTEGINMDTITVALGGSATPGNLTDLYVVYGSKTTPTKATGATSQSWSVNEAIAANTTMTISVYANLTTSNTAGQTVIPTVTVGGTSQNSGGAVTSLATGGQTITVGTGSLTGAVDASTPTAALVVGNSMPKVASFKFTGQNDTFTITELTATTSDSSSIVELVFKDGAAELGRVPFDGTTATKTGLSIAIPYNSNKTVDVYVSLGSVGTGAGTSSANVGIALTAMKYRNSNGVETATSSMSGSGVAGSLQGNAMYAFKTKPVISNVALPTTVLAAGTMTIGKISVTADAGGTVDINKIIFNVSTSSATIATPNLYDDADHGTALGTCSLITGNTQISCANVNKAVSGSKTFVLKAVVSGTITTGSTVSTSISTPSTYAVPNVAAVVAATTASFVWSDESLLGHALTTADWNNDYLVKNLPTDSQTLTK